MELLIYYRYYKDVLDFIKEKLEWNQIIDENRKTMVDC